MIVLTVLDDCAADTLPAIRGLAERFPGHETLRIDVGASRLTLGPAFGVAQALGLLVGLEEFGAVEVIETEAAT